MCRKSFHFSDVLNATFALKRRNKFGPHAFSIEFFIFYASYSMYGHMYYACGNVWVFIPFTIQNVDLKAILCAVTLCVSQHMFIYL